MTRCIVLLTRSLSIPKQVWREGSCLRTFAPIDIAPLLRSIWHANQSLVPERGSLAVDLQPEGSPLGEPRIHPIEGKAKEHIGVFACSFATDGKVRVVLREDACTRLLGVPRRPGRQIALLRPWEPVRVLLNGRSADYSGQRYLVLEHHLTLCGETVPDAIAVTRLVDLQADLM